MKIITSVKLGCGALAVFASLLAASNAWPQASGGGVAQPGSMAAASGSVSPKAARQANRALRKKVYAALAQHKEIDAGNLSVTAKEGAVTLGGTVTAAEQVDKVAGIVKSVPGVTSVTNRLTVQQRFGGQ
jgi:hyperosmotically inducible periplasmic protein